MYILLISNVQIICYLPGAKYYLIEAYKLKHIKIFYNQGDINQIITIMNI
jgi:hypothetical protein